MSALVEGVDEGVVQSEVREGTYRKATKNTEHVHTDERIHILLGKNMAARLEKLRERVEPSTRTEVFRVSLRLLEDVVKELNEGKEFFVRDKDGALHPYRVFLS